MNRIQCPDGFDRKSAPGARKDHFRNAHYVTALCKPLYRAQRSPFLRTSDPSSDAGSQHSAARFRNREG